MPILLSALVFVCAHETRAGSYQSPLDYASSAVFTITNYTKAAAQAYFPLYLKIAEDNPKGFRYQDLKNGKEEIRFLDSTGQSLAYETVSWDENGESAFWICVPSLRSGETITMCWNLRDGCNLPPREVTKDRESVWSDYVGVWHMDETITAAEAETTYSKDATINGRDLIPRIGREGVYTTMTSVPGVFGNARVNDTKDRNKKEGGYLEISNSSDMTFNGVFTLSFWIKFDAYANYPQLMSRRSSSSDYTGFQSDLASDNEKGIPEGAVARQCIIARGTTQTGEYRKVVDKPFAEMGFVHLVYVYNGPKVSIYSDGVCRVDEMTIGTASDNGLPICLGNRNGGTDQSVWGKYDEVRLYKGVRSADSIILEHAQGTNALYAAGAVTNDWTAILKNEWIERPSITRTTWPKGTHPALADFKATPKHNADKMYIEFYNRGTGENIGLNPPTKPGEYRAVFIVPQADGWGALQDEVGFRIVKDEGTHKLAGSAGRILLAQDDYSVAGAFVSYQAYNDELPDDTDPQVWKLPYWRHLAADHETDESSTPESEEWEDDWSVSPLYNFGGGTYHRYHYPTNGEDLVLWTLDGVRVGNTFRLNEWTQGTGGLSAEQNYLPWNDFALRVLNFADDPIDGYRRYAGQMLLQNRIGAQIVSSCYTNGIGTIYFDAVNGWTDNIFNDEGGNNYELVVEVSTNAIGSTRPPTDENVSSNPEKGDAAYDPFLYAEWKPVPVRVLRFDGATCTDLGTQDRLDPAINQGGMVQRFYRVIVPVNVGVPARFRIRRTARDPNLSWNPDGNAYILVDNVICSDPASKLNLSPYGLYDASLTGKSVQGWGGAFVPAFPAADDTIYPRLKATMPDGSAVPEDVISAATMHYRWHYIDQRMTDWLAADLDPKTLGARKPLAVPSVAGDIEFWFEANPHGTYYEYGDYSGLGLGLGNCGYSEAVLAITNHAPTYVEATKTGNWFVRMREGTSAYSSMKLLVKTSERGAVNEVEMYVSDNHLWRGYYRMKEKLRDGFWWRIEPRDEQVDGATTWNYSTNRWYVTDWAEKSPTFPATGRMSEGTETSWSRMPCDAETGYLMFQVDDETRGITVIHADYQNFNDWNQPNDFFSGSSADTNTMHGTSSDVKTYVEDYARWRDESATNKNWQLVFTKQIDVPGGYKGYTQFASYTEFDDWNLGKGMWVYGKYREPNSKSAYQAAGCGEGYAEFVKKRNLEWPRGIGSVSFNARLAQAISPEFLSYADDSSRLTNYTFMARGCFDMDANRSFAGNAAISLFAYYKADTGAYEARWEQIQGEETTNPGYATKYLGPKNPGQRLVITRWNKSGNTFKGEELIAYTNAVKMPLMADASATNNLLPICISVYQLEKDGPTYIVAGVRVEEKEPTGVTPDSEIETYRPRSTEGKNWYFVTYRDTNAKRLTRGSYGVLTSNSEGMLLRPQYMPQPAWPGNKATPQEVEDQKLSKYNLITQTASPAFTNCRDDIAAGYWVVSPAREKVYLGSSANYYGFTYVAEPQTIDVYTSPVDRDIWTKRGEIPITDFGTPYNQPDVQTNLYFTENCQVRLKTGGTLDDYRKDVTLSDIVLTQWRGRDNWSTSGTDWNFDTDEPKSANNFGYTNIVFTSGWVTNKAVRLSAKRTTPGYACSVRSPVFDGEYQAGYGYHSVGLGLISIRYREPTQNIRLKVQVATNYNTIVSTLSRSVTESATQWITLTNLTYTMLMDAAHWDAAKGEGVWTTRLGWHGVKGMMRIALDDELTREVVTETDPTRFGEIDILEAVCKDEPALDKGCWWGWNLKAVGDLHDTAQRMYLADYSPLSRLAFTGQSMALNNSTVDGTDPSEDPEKFAQHLPFVQSPSFTNAVIGQISFKARKYELSDRAPDAKVVVYGAPQTPDRLPKDSQWTKIAEFDVTNTLYESFTCKTQSEKYYALRLVVLIGGTEYPPKEAAGVKNPQRVLFDEVVISEAVSAMLSFRNVGAFRDGLETTGYVPGVTTAAQQPLCDENWGIQAEVFATMLEDEIYRERAPNVTLHWFVGDAPWGYENWKDLAAAGHAKLAAADGTNYVYRSSYEKAPDAVMPAQDEAGTVVQYMLEVEYWTIHSDKEGISILPATNWLDSVAWSTPSWYAPIDYNADAEHGAGKTFAGYTILDTIAPGWAWINEMNIFGTYTKSYKNTDEQFQYVEVCVPAEADLSGWSLRMLDASDTGEKVITNNIAFFGSGGVPGKKAELRGLASNMVFRCVGNKVSERMKRTDGTLDGIWSFEDEAVSKSTIFAHGAGYDYIGDVEIPFGVQLLRPSGIIESSVVVVGTNSWEGFIPEYEPSNIVAKLNRLVPGSDFFYPCADEKGEGKSESVIDSRGESAEHWANDWLNSPGYLNTNGTGRVQQIDPNHPTPKGDRVLVYARIDQSGGPIRQYVGGKGSTATNEVELIILRRGGEGTNIVYEVDPWYEIATVMTNGRPAWVPGPKALRELNFTVGKGASNNIDVLSFARVDRELSEKYGLDENNPYTPAVMDWLVGGATCYRDFENNGTVSLAGYYNLEDEFVTNLTLTTMYWLDMDPTMTNQMLKGGMASVDPYECEWRGVNVTNVRCRVFLMISNNLDNAYAPYVLRGIEPKSLSWDYTEGSTVTWTSETFKVTGFLNNGLISPKNPSAWQPLRFFVFHKDSFYRPDTAPEGETPFTAKIEIVDPHTDFSEGAKEAGWPEWCRIFGYTDIWHRWSLDTRARPTTIEILKPDSYYKEDLSK